MSAPINILPHAEVRTEVRIPLRFADGFEATERVSTFRHLSDGADHPLLSFDGTSPSDDAPLVRLHSECLTGDVFGSPQVLLESRCVGGALIGVGDCGVRRYLSVPVIDCFPNQNATGKPSYVV
ncbi:hypothetical protein [Microbacterium testaceum]|uniref:hypothetical protein n=1 Tax=Microbacterium testaceum TaxID=2033 RepID=UPI002156159C|nr:hypothetical protein [Microbacterium testaceum]